MYEKKYFRLVTLSVTKIELILKKSSPNESKRHLSAFQTIINYKVLLDLKQMV